jgi:FkbM family methyltransferase
MSLYGQTAEAQLLVALLGELRSKVALDVGAELGDITALLREAGAERVIAFEPAPDNIARLTERFADDGKVVVLPKAVSSEDGELELHLSTSAAGSPISYGHTFLSRSNTDEIGWNETVTVGTRSLDSLVREGAIDTQVGILKIDTEGFDLEVLKGMGKLEAEVVMIEHWVDLPHSLGACPWNLEDVTAELEPRGFHHFAFITHRGEFTILQWDDGTVLPGNMGNLVFIHDLALERSMPHILATASSLSIAVVELAQERAEAASERLDVIAELEGERELQARVAAERLDLLHELQSKPRT